MSDVNDLTRVCIYCHRTPLAGAGGEERWVPLGCVCDGRKEPLLTHGVCPECYQRIVLPELRALAKERREDSAVA